MAAHLAREGDASSDLLVYGYLRVEEPDEREIAVLRAEMNQFCATHGYRLGVVFCDRGVLGDATARTGFTGLLDVLRLPEAHSVRVNSDLVNVAMRIMDDSAQAAEQREFGSRLITLGEALQARARQSAMGGG